MLFHRSPNSDSDADRAQEMNEKLEAVRSGVHSIQVAPSTGDIAAQYAADGEIQLTPEMDKRLRRKADLYIMPIISIVYGIQFADKLIPSSANVLNLSSDLFAHSSTGYNWVGSSFYLGYLVFEFPMSYLMQKCRLDAYGGILTITWGVLLACTAACTNMESFLACRVLLGMLECGIQPTFTVVVSQWYKRDETYSRTCLWFAANGFGGLFVSSIGYGLAYYSNGQDSYYGMQPWKMLYILMGLITIVLGVALGLMMPNTPSQAKFLNEEEKRMQIERIRHNNQGFGTRSFKPYQVKEALLDPRTWIYAASELLGNIPNGGITVFTTLILNGLGYEGNSALLMSMPASAVELVAMLLIAFISSKFLVKHRLVYAIAGSGLGVAFLSLIAWGPNTNSQLAGLYMSSACGVLTYVGFISMIESDAAGTTKKITVNAILLMFYCAGNIIGPQLFYTREKPEYPTGKRAMAAAQAAQFVLVCGLAVLNYAENKRRDKAGITKPPDDVINVEFADLTDKEMPWFRYSL